MASSNPTAPLGIAPPAPSPSPFGTLGPWGPARTPGPLGLNDQADPLRSTLLGDTPGPLGWRDSGDPSLPRLGDPSTLAPVATAADGKPVALAVNAAADTAGKITKEQLKKIFTSGDDDFMQKVADELNTDLKKYGLDTARRKAHFFAQAREEGGAALEAKVENLNYSADALKSKFSYYKKNPTEAVTDAYERDPKTKKITKAADQQTIGNNIYGDRLGNGNAASGDGWNFRGRGLIQVTGRDNYKAMTTQYQALYGTTDKIDFEATPEKMAEYPYDVRSAVCFWTAHGLDKLADNGATDADVDAITAVINKNTDSYANRRDHFKVASDAFK